MRHQLIIVLLAAIFALTSCTAAPSPQLQSGQTAAPDATLSSSSTATIIPPKRSPTVTPTTTNTTTAAQKPTRTVRPTATSRPFPTEITPPAPMLTEFALTRAAPTEIENTPWFRPSETLMATAVPISQDNSFAQGLTKDGYFPYSASSTVGPDGYTYSAFVFLDSTFTVDGEYGPGAYRQLNDAETTEGCRIVFYRWDGTENVMLYSFGAPQYPDGSIYHHYPISCYMSNWNVLYTWMASDWTHEEVFSTLGLRNAWSDINQNGLPEFSVQYQYCHNGCLDYGALDMHFYEIQSTSKIVDITADLPGALEPHDFIYSLDPLILKVLDPTKEYCYKWCPLGPPWYYAWAGEKLADVTPAYPEITRQQGNHMSEWVKKQFTNPKYEPWALLRILFLYEKAGLGQEGLDLFLELSDPDQWIAASAEDICWLQIARAAMQEDFANGQPFHMLPLYGMDRELEKIDPSKYDVSRCEGVNMGGM